MEKTVFSILKANSSNFWRKYFFSILKLIAVIFGGKCFILLRSFAVIFGENVFLLLKPIAVIFGEKCFHTTEANSSNFWRKMFLYY